jgi:SNF2 family DNA or RNA helicase
LTQFAQNATNLDIEFRLNPNEIAMSLSEGLFFLRDISGLRRIQGNFDFEYANEISAGILREHKNQLTLARNANTGQLRVDLQDWTELLKRKGFDKRILTKEQKRDLSILLSLNNGANFSVPGAGKTTVTLALNFLLDDEFDKMLVVCPKSAFQEWEKIIDLCISDPRKEEKFVRLIGDASTIRMLLDSNYKRFIINYEMARIHEPEIRRILISSRTHLVMDESHRIKAGLRNLTGSFALRIANLAKRRDILSGTPRTQGDSDLAAQADFLWPGLGLGYEIRSNQKSATEVMRGLFVRTTKAELGLPPVSRYFLDERMNKYQSILYATLADRVLAQFLSTSNRSTRTRSTGYVRLLQASVYPTLIPMEPWMSQNQRDILSLAWDEGLSPKMQKAIEICRSNAEKGRKTLVWTIFTETLLEMKKQMIDLNAETVFGGSPAESNEELSNRESAINNFLESKSCWVLIANPAAASEGLSLHSACHDAIYLDRNYNAGHFLQSIDRIHRLGLPADAVTNTTVLRSVTPDGIRCIDSAVSRRLFDKVRDLQAVLNDQDLREIAMAEDDARVAEDWEMTREDVIDLISELQGKTSYSKLEI